jgi:cytochrome c oxidase subunit II
MMNLIIGIGVVLVLVALLLIFRILTLVTVAKGSDKKRETTSNKLNAILFVVFFIVGFGLFFWYSNVAKENYLPEPSSEHGKTVDDLFWLTTYIITFVFVVTHVLLFLFPFKYQFKEGTRAHFYPDNNKLELLWTIVPAIVLTVLVFTGLQAWSRITADEPKESEVVEIMGYQFAWKTRYPGKDGQLGSYDFRLITAENEWGLDFRDQKSFDDFTPSDKILRIPKGQPVVFKIRARDVLHSVFAPHFRVKMDAVPGMPTKFWFVPTKTTEEMRAETGNPKFNYEIACTEICGRGHFSMRMLVEVLEPAEYKKWYDSQASWLSKNPDYLSKVPDNLKSVAQQQLPKDTASATNNNTQQTVTPTK